MIEAFIHHYPDILKAFRETIQMLSVSAFFSFMIGLPLGTCLYLSRKNGPRPHPRFYRFFSFLLNIIRSFPFMLFVVAMIPITRKIVGTSLGTVASMIPLSIIGVTVFARQVERSLLEVPKEIVHTATSLGASTWQLVIHFLYVEALPSLILSFSATLISLISYSTVLGVVGGGGIGNFAIIYGYQRYQYDLMYAAIILMIMLVQMIHFTGQKISSYLDRR